MPATRPTSEKGALQNTLGGSWDALIDNVEQVPKLTWPNNLRIYREMSGDAQVQALYRGTTLPIRRYQWSIDPNGAPDGLVGELAEDLNLPIKGEAATTVGRRKARFSFPQHLKWALESILWGHYPFEQVGEIVNGRWRLRKLAARPPRTVEMFKVAADGGLDLIKVPSGENGRSTVDISIDRLVMYVWDMEPGHWTGMSMLRAVYKNWLLKDRLLRIDLIKHDRAGSGIPTATAPPGATQPQIDALDEMTRAMRVDEEGGGAVPHGTDLRLMGITGTVPDTWESIRGHNEEMARSWLSQVMQLGQTQTGSRSLGEVHVEALHESQDAIAGWFADTFNEHVIEDWVDWNYGPDTPAPQLVYEQPEDGSVAVADLSTMVKDGLIEVDEELETWLRTTYRMPEKGTPRATSTPAPGESVTQAAARRSAPIEAAEDAPSPLLPARTLRRRPYTHEIQAQVNFAELDTIHTEHGEDLVGKLKKAKEEQVAALVKAIEDAGDDVEKLSQIRAPVLGADDIERAILEAAKAGETGAKGEAVAQGVSSPKNPSARDEQAIRKRAVAIANTMANSISTSASKEAVRRAGTMSAKDLATSMKGYLNDLSSAPIEKQARGVVSHGITDGRTRFMETNKPTEIYASEIFDDNTCGPCGSVDGQQYDSIDAAKVDYPNGYVGCEGGDYCRGTVVAVYNEAAPTME